MNINETTIRGRSRMASCIHKAGVGNNTYRLSNSQYAVKSISNQPAPLPSSLLNIMYNAWGKIETISLNKYNGTALSMDIVYGPDQERWCSEYTVENGSVRETIYAGNYEKVTENGITREFYYLDGNVIVVKQNGVFTPYLAFKDNLGSFLSIWDAEGEKVFDADYDAWGKQEVYLNDIGFQRGYTGHEMLDEFDIINMNGRLYDPTIARFLSPDNYVQAPDNSQNFNRYSYCLNNPLKYNDPSGEFWEWVIAGAIMGAIQSGAMAEMNEGKNFWSGAWKGAIVGAGSAAAGMGVGAAVSSALGSTGAIAGFASGFAGGAVSGFASGTSSAWLNGASFKSGLQSGLYSSAVSAVMGGTIGGIHGGLDAYQHGGNFWTGKGATYEYSISSWENGKRYDMNEKIEIGEGMEYTNEYVRDFSKKNFPNMKCIDNLYADGSVPNKTYYSKNGYIYNINKGHYVEGICINNGLGKGSNVYLAKTAFLSKEKLYLTMGHEYLHALYNGQYYQHREAHHPYIYEWQYQQAKAWQCYENAYKGLYSNNHRDPLWRMYNFKFYSNQFPGIIHSRPL